ncbi:MAG: ATP/GTP-binding protein [Alphaproteobacteria bacterium]|nr:ATP/GTP-binding protein [Alphaproteobacteria bacterium]
MTLSAFVGTSMQEAMEKAKRVLGDDAFIIRSELTVDGVKIYAQKQLEDNPYITEENLSSSIEDERVIAPVIRSNLKASKETHTIHTHIINMITEIVQLCDAHHAGGKFCDAWIQALSRKSDPLDHILENSFSDLISFMPEWIFKLSDQVPVTFVGPPGAGKTSFIGRLSAVLKSKGKNVRVLTLDDKAGSFEQLKTYMDILEIPIAQGIENFANSKQQAKVNQEILLIDTPGVNVLDDQGHKYMYHLSEYIKSPLTLVMPNDIQDYIIEEMAKEFAQYNTKYIIGTRFDINKHYGAFLRCAHNYQLIPILYSQSPEITSTPCIISASSMIQLMRVV